MSLFIRLDVGFWTHRKTLRLRAVLADAAFWIPPRLWSYAATNQPDGDFSDYSATELAMLVGYTGDAKAMLQALQQASFLDGMKIHGWQEHNGYHRKFAQRAKKAANARWKKEREEKEKTGEREEKIGQEKRQAMLDECLSILEHLNLTAGKRHRPTKTSLAFIRARLAEEGVTADGCRLMIDRQTKMWKGGKMEEYLRPATLFNSEKFAGYYDSRELPLPPNGMTSRVEQQREAARSKEFPLGHSVPHEVFTD